MPLTFSITVTIPPGLKHIAQSGFGAEFAAAHANTGPQARASATFHDRTGATRGSIASSVTSSGPYGWIARLSEGTVAGAVWEFGMRNRNVIYHRRTSNVNVSRDALPKRLFLLQTMQKARGEFSRALRAKLSGI